MQLETPTKPDHGSPSHWATWRKFRQNTLSVIGLALLSVLLAASLGAPLISSYAPDRTDLSADARLQSPSTTHWFGTDHLGRDVLARTFFGGRISLLVGLIAAALAVGIGLAVGIPAGFYGQWLDNVAMRLIDVLLSLPLFFVIVILQSWASQPSIFNVIGVIGITSWMGTARLVRGQILKERGSDYALAAYSVGLSAGRIMIRHLLPNIAGVVTVAATLQVARAILLEAGLSFLGFGVQPPEASWGSMLTEARSYLNTGPWMALFPGTFLCLTILSFNFIGDGLAGALDPHERP